MDWIRDPLHATRILYPKVMDLWKQEKCSCLLLNQATGSPGWVPSTQTGSSYGGFHVNSFSLYLLKENLFTEIWTWHFQVFPRFHSTAGPQAIFRLTWRVPQSYRVNFRGLGKWLPWEGQAAKIGMSISYKHWRAPLCGIPRTDGEFLKHPEKKTCWRMPNALVNLWGKNPDHLKLQSPGNNSGGGEFGKLSR